MDEEKIIDESKKDEISEHKIHWRCNNGYDGDIYLKERIEIDKFVFHDREYLDLRKMYREMNDPKIKGPPPNLNRGFYISQKITSDNNEQGYEETKIELKHILNLITLHTNCTFRLGFFQIDNTIKDVDSAISKHFALSDNIAKSVLQVKEIIEKMDVVKNDLMKRAISWYHRGTIDPDKLNSFANYWIGFELLSYWFGKDEVSIRSRLSEFGKKLNLSSTENKKILELYVLRNNLFHSAKPITSQEKVEVRELLKKCIVLCLGLKEFECSDRPVECFMSEEIRSAPKF